MISFFSKKKTNLRPIGSNMVFLWHCISPCAGRGHKAKGKRCGAVGFSFKDRATLSMGRCAPLCTRCLSHHISSPPLGNKQGVCISEQRDSSQRQVSSFSWESEEGTHCLSVSWWLVAANKQCPHVFFLLVISSIQQNSIQQLLTNDWLWASHWLIILCTLSAFKDFMNWCQTL